MNRSIPVLLPLLLTFGCSEAPPPTKPAAAPAVQKLVLKTDPGPALSVVAAKKQGPTKRVVVEGRIHDITKGFALMKLMSKDMDFCGQVDKTDKCPTPWDYCCDSQEDRVANSLLVEARGADGKPLSTDQLPNARHCDLVKVVGEMVKDEHGNAVLIAEGWFQVERPAMPDYVKWPQ